MASPKPEFPSPSGFIVYGVSTNHWNNKQYFLFFKKEKKYNDSRLYDPKICIPKLVITAQ